MLSQKTIEIVKSTAPVLAEKGVEITKCFYKNLFSSHPELLNIFNHANQAKGRQQTALANTVYAAATYIDQLEVLIPAVKQIAHKHRSLAVKPEHYPIVGEHLLGAIKEVLGDAATDEIINAWAEAYGVIAQVFIDVEKEMYEEATNQTGGWKDFKKFKVVKKVEESAIITSFYLEPSDKTALPAFLPGQYITIRLSIPGETNLLNRQYSLSDAAGQSTFRISVKRESEYTPKGKVSNYLHDHINMGDELEVTAPAGDFVLNAEKSAPVYLISGGVGITPMMSMLKTVAASQPKTHSSFAQKIMSMLKTKETAQLNNPVTFIHAAKNGTVHAFHDEVCETIEKLQNARRYFVYEQPTSEDYVKKQFNGEGYLDLEKLRSIVTEKEAQFYICGPVEFMKATVINLEKLGVAEENIHYEFFGPALNLKEYEMA
ncbi:NO-inducible flavohemoprotein [Metabacillus fastidiosus]|uniref:NO-inducible flavohemoprotein n=1 Tax=Metabacillus fastidiosus TaxID=1458 RepID=UPI002E24261A|nr:NO-inducible flavohemoprotein [Metabacillus fastidiosus]MED4531112.1 NO-inducible flavohemoprotein [Metabacillus fastidiosus]